MADPLIKWAGGKSWLLPEITKRMPKKFGHYYEPFIGGGALFFHLEREFGQSTIGDFNENLVNTYKSVARCLPVVDSHLEDHQKRHSKQHFKAVRAAWNRTFWTTPDTVNGTGSQWSRRAALFLYLNRTCFNGLWRENKAGKFNVPIGDYKKPKIWNPDRLAHASSLLWRSQIVCGPFWSTVVNAKKDDFVYFDPPYDPVSATSSFVAYGREGFGRREQKHLAVVADDLAAKDVHVMLSNSNTRFVRELYKGWNITKVFRPGNMNSDISKRGRVAELLITNY